MATQVYYDAGYVEAGDMTGEVIGPPIDCDEEQQLSFHNVWDGNPTGAFVYEVSNDPTAGDDPDNADWIDVTAESIPVLGDADPAAGGVGHQMRVVRDLPKWARQRFVGSGAAGNLDTYAHGRRI